MLRREKKKILPDLIFSKFFVVLLIFVFFVILFGLAKGSVKKHKVASEIKDLETEINNLEYKNKDLGQLITYLKSDTFIEQEAKLKMGYKREGEELVVIPDQQLEPKNVVEAKKISEDLPNPLKWWQYFFN